MGKPTTSNSLMRRCGPRIAATHSWRCLVALLTLTALLVLLAGCGGGGGGDGATGSTGQLQVGLTDQSGTFRSVGLAINEVRVNPVGQGNDPTSGLPLIKAFNTPLAVDVLALLFQQQLLGSAVVPAGTYEQVRLVLAENQPGQEPVNFVTLNSDPSTKHPLKTPSGQESGLKVLGSFQVQPGVLNAILLDFSPDKAIVQAGQSGQFLLKPTGIRIVQVQPSLSSFGALSGSVMPPTAWPTAAVSVVPQGSTSAIASGTIDPDNGWFRAFVPAGSYSVRVTANGFQPFDSAQQNPPRFFSVATGQDTAVDGDPATTGAQAITLLVP
ncbi:MAG: hypothetical protein COY42_10910 [Armatimonadetes bacterium CG_4_10_14_0_8_um_filter_66_14]|nr:MAG: hypothetical protein COY42_10910 [Armatimonadetes bacterium CG_4_10_14_0_8_um_filter_66_14]